MIDTKKIGKIDVKLFDTEETTIKKCKWHYIEFDGNVFHLRANYLSEETVEEIPTECWRFWDETIYKSGVMSYGFYRSMIEKDWVWVYHIYLNGREDILLIFDSQEKVQKFHELFKQYMN
jgi:hypothetical protein